MKVVDFHGHPSFEGQRIADNMASDADGCGKYCHEVRLESIFIM